MKLVTLLFISAIFILFSCNNDPANKELAESTNENKDEQQTISANTIESREIVSLGEKMFILCEACHSLKEGEAHKTGPNLHQIFGSKAAVRDGFVYSEALKESSVVWDKENMRKWIDNPMEFIPNSNMAFVGVKKKDQQDALIEYLIEQTK